MTPPNPKPVPIDPLQFGLRLIQPAPLLVQKEAPNFPITGKVELDGHGGAKYMVVVDVLALLAGGGAGRGASAGVRAASGKHGAATLGKAAAALGKTASKATAAKTAGSVISDGIAQGLHDYFGSAPTRLLDLADKVWPF